MSKLSSRKNTALVLAAVFISGAGRRRGAGSARGSPGGHAGGGARGTDSSPARGGHARPAARGGGPARPQPQPQPAARPAPRPAPAQPEEMPVEEYVEEMVVTGSRIPRKELTTAAPGDGARQGADRERRARTSIGEILQSLPEQSNAINTQVNNGGDGATRVNLRGLGTERTLVLLNGRRHVAGGTGADASVDLNAIPTAAIQRIEILKDGGSAVYGSDAIAGVVNIITRSDFSGTEAAGLHRHLPARRRPALRPELHHRPEHRARQHPVHRGLLQPEGRVRRATASSASTTRSTTSARGRSPPQGSSSTPQGVFFTRRRPASGNQAWAALTAQYPTARPLHPGPHDGEWRPFSGVGVTDAGGDLYNYQPENYLVTPQDRVNVYSTGGLRLGGSARGLLRGLLHQPPVGPAAGARAALHRDRGPRRLGGTTSTTRSAATSRTCGAACVEFGTRDFAQDIDTFRIVTGVEGKLAEDSALDGWRWDLAYNYGRTQGIDDQGRARCSAAGWRRHRPQLHRPDHRRGRAAARPRRPSLAASR